MYLDLHHLFLHFSTCRHSIIPISSLFPKAVIPTKQALKFRETVRPGAKHSLTPSPVIFKKAVDHTCSRFILRCGNHDEGNITECVICLGAVTLCFYGNTPPGITVILLSFLLLPAILQKQPRPCKKGQQEWFVKS